MRSFYLKDLLNNYRKSYPSHYNLYISLDDVVIKVLINNFNLEEKLKSYFREFIVHRSDPDIEITAIEAPVPHLSHCNLNKKEPDAGKSVVKEEYLDFDDGRIVRKCLTGMVFFFDGCDNLAVGPCVANSNQIVNFINNRFIEYRLKEGLILLHASGICNDNKGIAISGFSGMGKSTLALHLLNYNLKFVSNDRILVQDAQDADNVLRMVGVAKYPRINPGTIINNKKLRPILTKHEIEEYESLSEDELWKTEKKYDLFIDEVYGKDIFNISSPLHTLIILNWHRDSTEETTLKEVNIFERRDLYPAFIKMPGLFYINGVSTNSDFNVENYIKIISKCEILEVTGKLDFEFVTLKIVDFLNQRGSNKFPNKLKEKVVF